MGKRNKHRDNMTAAGMIEITDSSTVSDEKVIQEEKQKKRKNNKNKAIDNNIKNMKSDTDEGLTTENKNSDNIEEDVIQTSMHKDIKKKKKRKKNEANEENTLLNIHNEIPKKIKFGDDGEPDLHMVENKNKKSYLNDEEQAIHDDDIDQFCNDINEEDNKQYESWISLLEQKLGSKVNSSNKKKKKNKSAI